MKKFFQKILSISLALIVFLSTMSFTVVSNYCADNLVDYSFFDNASWCNEMPDDSFSKICEISEVPCCSSDQFVVEGQDDLQMNSVESLTFDQQLFVATFTYSFVNLFEVGDKETIPFANYTPPLLVRDILLLDQTFLI
ncbi:hypothetical protein RM553_06795 [Zunongwangia sp. F363]|uniref:Secreted protein n=1 Tax=Autumnicola tepida TaxID=3075595 RepID=A0ABU3C8E8_9FLAO|nr:hypothetical protein [Zunongwangia sp. F363]MDT0642538.1 hypothetical protein [Zunongwangia sp. F363]